MILRYEDGYVHGYRQALADMLYLMRVHELPSDEAHHQCQEHSLRLKTWSLCAMPNPPTLKQSYRSHGGRDQ